MNANNNGKNMFGGGCKSKHKKVLIFLSLLLILIITGVTLAKLNINIPGISNIISKPAKVSLTYIEPEEALISDEFGLSIEEGKILNNYFEFTVSSTSEVAMNIPYNIYITEEEKNTLDREKIYVYITEVVDNEEVELLHPQKLIYFSDYYKYENSYILTNDNFRFEGTKEETKERTYRLRMWVDAEANVITNEDGSQSINIEGGTYEYKVHVDTNVAPEYCFAYTIDETTNEATITDFYCATGNKNGYETITDLIIPTKLNEANVTIIGANAFKWNPIKTVVIPNEVTTLNKDSFSNGDLTSITIGGKVTTINNYAFIKNELTKIIISDRVTSLSPAFVQNQMSDEEAYIYARTDANGDGIIQPEEIDYTTIINYAGANKEPIIPEGVKNIAQRAFYGEVLTGITFPTTLEYISYESFLDNRIEKLVIPENVTFIGDRAFGFNNLEYVVIPENSKLTELTGIAGQAFTSSSRTENGCVDNSNLTTIYNNSGKAFKWSYIIQIRQDEAYNFITGTVPSYTDGSGNIYNEVVITTGYPE